LDRRAPDREERSGEVNKISDLIDRYVAVWNEPDADVRRKTIATLWAPDGATCHRLLDSRGYEAIEARVGDAHRRWVRSQGYVFGSPKNAVGHHDVVKFSWEMTSAAGGGPASAGLNVLILDREGRIRFDYQFSEPGAPPSPELEELVERYVAFWNESDPDRRHERLAELWAQDSAYVSPSSKKLGRAAIELEAAAAYEAFVAKGFIFRSKRGDGHHNVVRCDWEMRRSADEAPAAAGFDLLVLDDDGRIRADYQFDET
jgi:hypothetical protein